MFEALLPVSDYDFHVGYVERLVLCLYSLAFLTSPELQYRTNRDGTLGLSEAMLKLRSCTPPMESRQTFAGLIHWVIELLKVVDSTSIPRQMLPVMHQFIAFRPDLLSHEASARYENEVASWQPAVISLRRQWPLVWGPQRFVLGKSVRNRGRR